MDKYDKVFDIVDHPERYSDKEIDDILRDPELRDIYNTLCDADSALRTDKCPEPSLPDKEAIDREWQRLSQSGRTRKNIFHIFRQRAAAAGIIAISSIAALAIGFGIATKDRKVNKTQSDDTIVPTAVAADSRCETDTVISIDSVAGAAKTTIYENETLGRILSDISGHYGLSLDIRNEPATKLRLYFKWDRAKEPDSIIFQLNNFEKINLSLSEKTLSVN